MKKKRIVVKVGTNVLTNKDNRIMKPVLQELVRQIYTLYEQDVMTVLVSSGSVIAGKEVLAQNKIEDKVVRAQVYSAVGQPRMMRHYYGLFNDYGMRCAQVLATKLDFSEDEYRQNLLNCYDGLISQGIVPIANEDDATSLPASMFTDNDELAGMIAELIDADQMILLTDTDGLYNGNPEDAHTEKFSKVKVDWDVEQYVQVCNKKEGEGRGGMHSKLKIAKNTAAKGIPTTMARGKTQNVIVDIVNGKDVGTKFLA